MIKKIFSLGLIALTLAVTVPAWSAPDKQTIRVAVLVGVDSVDISVRGRYKIANFKGDNVVFEGSNLLLGRVIAEKKGMRVGTMTFGVDRLRIIPHQDGTVAVKNRKFRGEVDLIKGKDGKFTVVNVVEIEDYIQGVLYHEISNRWPIEAIKAQAIATRTYALFRISANTRKDYDVTNDIYSQVYGGKTSEKYRTNLAVRRTEGKVMVYKGKILPAYFHACCGGYTEDVSELWKQDVPPLKGVACPFCAKSPHFNWKRNFRLKTIQDKLNDNGYKLGLIETIEVVERNKGGRIRSLKISTRDDQVVFISGKDFRNIVGPNEIRSNNFEIVMKGYYVDLIGHGWGHGVGLCQWGALEMAKEGRTCEDILDFYYPGMEIIDDKDVRL